MPMLSQRPALEALNPGQTRAPKGWIADLQASHEREDHAGTRVHAMQPPLPTAYCHYLQPTAITLSVLPRMAMPPNVLYEGGHEGSCGRKGRLLDVWENCGARTSVVTEYFDRVVSEV
ncbi:hypothetical protein BGZ58_006394, partial [Dissophora ornata]